MSAVGFKCFFFPLRASVWSPVVLRPAPSCTVIGLIFSTTSISSSPSSFRTTLRCLLLLFLLRLLLLKRCCSCCLLVVHLTVAFDFWAVLMECFWPETPVGLAVKVVV